ncbi:MAG: N(4)-(beta-N-acetylglucosaminyl)-L-asparaginase [Clostridia bacterium]|nr:N(4)-(beta-N-acetylglucosaminyl)-L-asparaginase [Clostridia bacterium]
MRAIIGTWKMSFDGVREAFDMLKNGASAGEAVVHAVTRVEDEPAFRSVGFGGLPGLDGRVTLDAAFMDGRTLRVGGVMSAENIGNPILAAYRLCGRKTNCLLAGRGAEEFAVREGLPMRDMRTGESMKRWREAVSARSDSAPEAYRGHDTVCVLALDESGNMAAGTSTSGLFMKEPGRVGDTPLIGSGFYCDARFGAAAATGLGEDIMRGCLSYEAVSRMRRGETPLEACRNALSALAERKRELGEDAGSISLIALAPDGAFGAATTLPVFPFSEGHGGATALYMVENDSNGEIRPADPQKLMALD